MTTSLIGKINLQTLETYEMGNEDITKIIRLLQNYNLEEFEKNISEDLNKEIIERNSKDEKHTYIEFNKYSFLIYLQKQFEICKNQGNAMLNIYEGICGDESCEFGGSKNYCFEGDKDKKRFAFLVSFKNGDILNEENQLKIARSCANFLDNNGNSLELEFDYYWESLKTMAKYR